MPYLLKGDLTPPLYQEIIDEITREDQDIVNKCINKAITKAKSYLMRFDLIFLFGDGETDGFDDENLKGIVKDIACWELIKLSNPSIDLKLFRTSYEDAIKSLEGIKKSEQAPDGWKYKDDDSNTPFPEGSVITSTSNQTRQNHW